MKRLLCILSGMNAGGAETFLMKVYRAIDRTRYQMDFAVNIREKGFYDDEIISMGGSIYHFPSKSESFIRYLKTLRNIIKENNYNYVLRITSNASGFLDLAIAKHVGAKVCIARSSNSSDGNGIKAKLAHYVGRKLLKKYVDVKIAPSTEAAVYTFGKKDVDFGLVSILPNGLDVNYYRYNEFERMRIRKEFEISQNTLVLGHVGRFNEQKNHEFLLKIFAEFHRQHSDSILMLVGDGILKKKIMAKAAELDILNSIVFTGVRSDMPALYSAMDVFVFPSMYEGMPNAVIEAQVMGLKCIVSENITKEADITGNVSYLSIENNYISEWVNLISISRNRNVDYVNFGDYDIRKTVVKFQDLVFCAPMINNSDSNTWNKENTR